ncbi:MAG: hypothetical protein ACFE9N_16260 [Promethearchaeota archaeon]
MKNSIKVEEQLEKIVFDKENLNNLKEALVKTKTGELSITELGTKILELRSDILNTLIEFIPFHLKLTNTDKALTEFTNTISDTNQLKEALKEKDQLLEVISSRINKIYENLENDIKSLE